jgi:hypothetical protein
MLEVVAHIGENSNNKSNDKTIIQDSLTSTLNTLFLHWKYSEMLESFDGFDAMTICSSRPKPPRDVLTNTVLDQPPDKKMSKILNNMKNTNPNGKMELLVSRAQEHAKPPNHKDANEKHQGSGYRRVISV